jgi:HEPN domain-containing protein
MESKNGWLFFAKRNLALAENIVDNPNFTAEVAFNCQQAIEKFFKAYLFEKNVPIQKTHDLGKLYSEIKKIKDLNIDEQKLVIIRDVYIESRYPSDIGLLANGSIPTSEDARMFFEFTQNVAKIVLSEIQPQGSDGKEEVTQTTA